jgi:hypothetical protein
VRFVIAFVFMFFGFFVVALGSQQMKARFNLLCTTEVDGAYNVLFFCFALFQFSCPQVNEVL